MKSEFLCRELPVFIYLMSLVEQNSAALDDEYRSHSVFFCTKVKQLPTLRLQQVLADDYSKTLSVAD